MQVFNPWGKEILGFQLEENILEQIKELSTYCQSYYLEVEKKRNGSADSESAPFYFKEEIFSKLDQICDRFKNQDPMYAFLLEPVLMKQSFIAALVAQMLGFEYRVLSVTHLDGKCEVRGMARDRASHKIESSGFSEFQHGDDHLQKMGGFYIASKKAFISAISTLSELDFSSKFSEVLI